MAPFSKFLIVCLASTSLAAPILNGRQLAGTGAALDSIFTDTDNGVGYGTKNAEDNTAATISGTKPKTPKRQTDKVANGFGNLANAAGAGSVASVVVPLADDADGQTTSDQADLGAQAGSDVANTLENTGSAVPRSVEARQLAGTGAALGSLFTDIDNGVGYGIENAEDNTAATISGTKGGVPQAGVPQKRQLDKIANGFGNVANAAGAGTVANIAVPLADDVDGQTTSDQATVGAQVGQDIETTLENTGSAVPRRA